MSTLSTTIQDQIKKPVFLFDEKKHVYTLDGKRLTGVTTILGQVIAKPALIQWSADMACQYIADKMPSIKAGEANGGEYWTINYESFLEHLKEARLAHRKKKEAAGDIGTQAHEQIERYIKGEPLQETTEQVGKMVSEFIKWAEENKVKFLESEKRLYSLENWYAGTVDFVAEIDGKIWIGDIKTSSGIYPEYFFQTSAYQNALQEMGHYPEIEGHIIVNIKKDGSKFMVERSYGYQDNLSAFLAALTIYRSQEKLKAVL